MVPNNRAFTELVSTQAGSSPSPRISAFLKRSEMRFSDYPFKAEDIRPYFAWNMILYLNVSGLMESMVSSPT